jgi:hypothetical protein
LFFRNGSTWDIAPDDIDKTPNFHPPRQRLEDGLWVDSPYHPIEPGYIMNGDLSSFYPYDFVMLNAGDRIKVRLVSDPITWHINPPPGKKIIGYGWEFITDISRDYIYLNDYRNWRVHPSDLHLLEKWQVNDHIIYGLNRDRTSPYPNIIINVRLKEHVKVHHN